MTVRTIPAQKYRVCDRCESIELDIPDLFEGRNIHMDTVSRTDKGAKIHKVIDLCTSCTDAFGVFMDELILHEEIEAAVEPENSEDT